MFVNTFHFTITFYFLTTLVLVAAVMSHESLHNNPSKKTKNKGAGGGQKRMGNFTSSGVPAAASVQFIQDLVAQNCVVIFSKSTCPYCKMAKNVFNEIGATYKVIELDQLDEGKKLQETLGQLTGAKTVPRVFINGNCIGGGSDTKQLHQQGKLVPLLEQCATSSEGSGSGKFESSE